MFEVGFTEIILILGLALLVLGPEKLPGLAEKVGRWTGRARAMARQLRTQLEQEVTMEEMTRSRPIAGRNAAPAAARTPESRREAAAPDARPRPELDLDAMVVPAIEPTTPSALSSGRTQPPMPPSQPTLRHEIRAMSDRATTARQLAEGSLISHLIELRERLLRAVIAVFAVLHSLRVLL